MERDDKRDLLIAEVTDRSGTQYPARALSDGTLRFLALTVIEEDDQVGGLLCLEEPENGIHPARIGAMLDLLRDIATDATVTDDEELREASSQLRQVIINTHSPAVVNSLPIDTLVVARRKPAAGGGQLNNQVEFAALPDTWRTQAPSPDAAEVVTIGELLAYLSPNEEPIAKKEPGTTPDLPKERRLRDVFNGQYDLFKQALESL